MTTWERLGLVLAGPLLLVGAVLKVLRAISAAVDSRGREATNRRSEELDRTTQRASGRAEEVERNIANLESEKESAKAGDGDLSEFFNGRKK